MKLKKTGFSIIEVLTVITIIGILVTIAYLSYKASIDRAKITNIKYNMFVLQNIVENFAIDNNGKYPATVTELKTEAKLEGYWKDFNNPYTGKIDPVTDLSVTPTLPATHYR